MSARQVDRGQGYRFGRSLVWHSNKAADEIDKCASRKSLFINTKCRCQRSTSGRVMKGDARPLQPPRCSCCRRARDCRQQDFHKCDVATLADLF